jgi:hypothetical protein
MRTRQVVKLYQLEAAAPIISRLYNANFKDMKAAYAMGKNAKMISKELETVNEIRQKLVLEYAQRDEKGQPVLAAQPGMVSLSPEKKDEFWEKYNEMLAQEVEIEVWRVTFSALETSKAEISPRELAVIEFLLDPNSLLLEPLAPIPPGENN